MSFNFTHSTEHLANGRVDFALDSFKAVLVSSVPTVDHRNAWEYLSDVTSEITGTAYVANGFDVTAVAASAEMLATARQHHPRLAGRFHQEGIPLSPGSAILGRQFDAIVSIATLMHIADQDLFETASQIRDLLVPGGILRRASPANQRSEIRGRKSAGRSRFQLTSDL